MNKTDDIRVRLTPPEKDIIQQKANQMGVKLSEYIRLSALNGTTYQIITTTEIKEIKE
jgi:uncharacterized protein (DUF1778 family)